MSDARLSQPRILILTASYGSGHHAAAAAVDAAFGAAGAETRIVDHFRDLVHPRFDRWSRRLYDLVLRRAPALWGLAYWLGDQMSASSRLTFDVSRLGSAKLARLLDAERFDGVVCTHPTPAAALGMLRARGRRTPPWAIVFSDFAAHRQWIHASADAHYVPAEAIRRQIIARGIPAARVAVTGIPVRREFGEAMDRTGARRALGLDPGLPVVLAMAGTFSRFGRLETVARVLGDLRVPLQALVVTGADFAVATRLGGMVGGTRGRIRILGYADNVRQLMAAADVLVTKAGGLSLAEALAAELPVICFGSLPGHEARNAAFLVSAGAALAARTAPELGRV
ncbi:MAG: MGDG synthase family glycosyltransferase, partial [Candidatus Rokuibacteriota bacterium]